MDSSYTGKAFAGAAIIATMIAGTLDMVSAFVSAALSGETSLDVLQSVGSALLDAEAANPATLATFGLVLHFAIMTVMVIAYLAIAGRVPLLNRMAVPSGAAYGLLLWLVMYWLVLPLRWPSLYPSIEPGKVGMQLFSHIVLVGIPIALVARAATRWRYGGRPLRFNLGG